MRKKITALLLACLMTVSAFTFTAFGEEEQPRTMGDRGLVIAIGADTPAIAPAQFNNITGFYVATMTHNGLFRICAETLQPIPDLVADWSVISDTEFEFTIHEGVMFHNGEEMTAEDIVASWEFARTFPIAATALAPLQYFEAVDTHTVRVDTGTPNAMLFISLASHETFIQPASLIEAEHDFNEEPVGSGPFIFEEWIHGDSFRFTANENYFDAERSARVPYVVIRIIPEGFTRTLALEAGEIDYNVNLQSSDVNRMLDDDNFTVVLTPGTQHNMMYLNNELTQFDTVYKRRIIGMAIDKESMMLAAHDGLTEATWSQGPAVFAGATEEGSYTFDPDGARELLEYHGIDPADMGFEILTHAGPRAVMAQVVQANLADIGIPVTITMQDVPTLQQRLNTGDFEAGFMGFTQSTLLGYLRLKFASFSISSTNRSRVDDPELDALIFAATAEVADADARNELLEQAVIRANEQTFQIPLHLATLIRAHNADLVVPEHAATDFPLYLNMVYWR